ncbi:MAG: hypothetical protein J0L93_04225 [Deltaproteobacteria bacterium]|nr:hypothetical protein [Deltaproteobacteria bacterium]
MQSLKSPLLFISLLLGSLGFSKEALSYPPVAEVLFTEPGNFLMEDQERVVIGLLMERKPYSLARIFLMGKSRPAIYSIKLQNPKFVSDLRLLARIKQADAIQGNSSSSVQHDIKHLESLALHQHSQREEWRPQNPFGPIAILDIDRAALNSRFDYRSTLDPTYFQVSVRVGRKSINFSPAELVLSPTKGFIELKAERETDLPKDLPRVFMTVGMGHLKREANIFCNRTLQGIVDGPKAREPLEP